MVVPFRGARGLFDMVPTQRGRELPEACVRPDELVLVIHAGQADPDRELERQKTLITESVARINADVDRFNREVAGMIRTRLASAVRDARRSAELALELGPPHRPRVTPADDRRSTRSRTANAATLAVPAVRRKAGRPRWPDDLLLTHYEAAIAATPEPRTLPAIAKNFRPLGGHELGISPGQLGRLVGRIAPRSE